MGKNGFEVKFKFDEFSVTETDKSAHKIIEARLQ